MDSPPSPEMKVGACYMDAPEDGSGGEAAVVAAVSLMSGLRESSYCND